MSQITSRKRQKIIKLMERERMLRNLFRRCQIQFDIKRISRDMFILETDVLIPEMDKVNKQLQKLLFGD